MGKTQIIAIANKKGGVGKTTTAVHLAKGLVNMGRSVLLVDCDSQANATEHLDFDPEEFELALDDLLFEDDVLAEDVRVEKDGLDLIPGSINLEMAEQRLSRIPGRETILKEKLGAYLDEYDFIIIDCPPSLDVVTQNAFTASSDIIVPIDCEYFAMTGLKQLMEIYSLVKQRLNESLAISGYVCTKYDDRKKQHKQVRQKIFDTFGDEVFRTVIRTNSKISESPMYGKTVFEHDPKGQGVTDYMNLSKEVEERYGR